MGSISFVFIGFLITSFLNIFLGGGPFWPPPLVFNNDSSMRKQEKIFSSKKLEKFWRKKTKENKTEKLLKFLFLFFHFNVWFEMLSGHILHEFIPKWVQKFLTFILMNKINTSKTWSFNQKFLWCSSMF